MKKYIASLILLLSLILLSSPSLIAQPPGFDDDVEDTPIDGGVSLLVAAGAGYGIKKIRDARRKNEEDNNNII